MAALTLTLAGSLTAAPAEAVDRYSVANGCFALQNADTGRTVAGAERVRLKATTLASYLIYRPDRSFLAASEDGSVAPAAEPSPAADWRVRDTGRPEVFALEPASQPGRVLLRVRFVAARGCAAYPEAALDATGTPAKGATSYGAVRGFMEGHMHWTTFNYLGGNFFCGRPWHPYGIPYALPDCSSIEGPQGTAAPVQNTLNYGNPAQPHDTRGYPYLTSWGSTKNLTYEGMYWRWVERAWASGLRLMVMSVNENRELCELQANRKYPCDEMTTVRRGFQTIREMQRYVDAQAGGPGKGYFQIVTNPNDARRVINAGKMAVVLEIEISELFGCRNLQQPTCDKASVDRQLDEMHRLGVRSSLLLNKFDNPLAGVRFDSGPIGVVINAGNRNSSGSFWSAETCKGPLTDNEIESGVPQGSAAFNGILAALGVSPGTVPTYPPAPHCNTRGLTELGRHVVRRMMAKKMIVNPDHMSQRGVDETLSLLEANDYSGVISPHGWMDPGNWPRLWKLGGVAFPGHSKATDYVKEYRQYRPKRTPVPQRLGLRRGPRRALAPARRRHGEVPVQVLRRQGHPPAPAHRRAQLRLQQGGRRPLRPLSRVVRGAAPARRRRHGARHGERLGGLPADVGAGGGNPRRRLPPSSRARARARPRAADPSPRLDTAAAARRPAPAARPRVDLLRARAAQPDQGGLRGAHHHRQGRAGGQHRPRPPRRAHLRGQPREPGAPGRRARSGAASTCAGPAGGRGSCTTCARAAFGWWPWQRASWRAAGAACARRCAARSEGARRMSSARSSRRARPARRSGARTSRALRISG